MAHLDRGALNDYLFLDKSWRSILQLGEEVREFQELLLRGSELRMEIRDHQMSLGKLILQNLDLSEEVTIVDVRLFDVLLKLDDVVLSISKLLLQALIFNRRR